MKTSISKDKFACPRSHYAVMRFSNFAIEYFHENEKVRELLVKGLLGTELLCVVVLLVKELLAVAGLSFFCLSLF